MKETARLSLEMLILSDLLRTKAIDRDLFDKAAAVITASTVTESSGGNPIGLATA